MAETETQPRVREVGTTVIDARASVRGDVVLAMIQVMGAFKTLAVSTLEQNGIHDPDAHGWYPLRGWLDSFRTIADKVGPSTIYQIGRQIPERGYYPAGVDSIDSVLQEVNTEYQRCHRGRGIGEYSFTFIGMRRGRMTSTAPYPCEFDRGLLLSLAHRFEPEDSFIDVRHEDGSCRERGDSSCVYTISW